MHTPLLRRRHFTLTLLALIGWGFAANALAVPVVPAQRVLVLGDSLSAEYGLARKTGHRSHQRQHQRRHHLRWALSPARLAQKTPTQPCGH
jgi:phospholipase/lecithinase/hemolysin